MFPHYKSLCQEQVFPTILSYIISGVNSAFIGFPLLFCDPAVQWFSSFSHRTEKGQDIRQYPAPSLSLTIALSVLSTPGYLLFFPRTAVHAASITAPAATAAAANENTSAVSPVFTAFAAELSAA